MSDSEDFQVQEFQYELDTKQESRLLSVRKYLENPKELMQKILFTSFRVEPFFPMQFISIPQMIKPDTAQKDTNNMNLIEQSAFRHQRLKKDVLGFLLNTNIQSKPPLKKILPPMSQYYDSKVPIYEKYHSNPKSKCMATYLLDSKTIIKQQLKKNNTGIFAHNKISSGHATHRSKIQFNSSFECGNLFRVYQIEYNQFDLLLQNDINTKGNNQWFFFYVKNVPKGATIKFNIVNLTKKHSLFDSGMKPCVFSMIRYEKRKVGWVRQGLKVSYDENDRFRKQHSQKPYYKLSFQYKFSYQGDIVYFSHSIPYTVTDLTSFISTHIKDSKNSKLIKLKDLNRTLGNQELDVIQITDQQQRQNKKVIWIVARQHSGQVTSSFMLQGIMNYLLSKTPKSNDLLRKYIFKIVPMINIDGVIHGNTRAQLNGTDPNRRWASPHKIRNPIIWALKKQIQKDKGRVQMFLDLHSHSRKLGTFFYGNSFRDNKFSTRKFPWMVCKNDERFTYSQCRFSQCNFNSARHVLFQILQIPLIYTVQSSFYGYQKNDHRIIQYLPNDYRNMGESLIQTFWHMKNPQYNSINLSIDKNIMKQIDQAQNDDKQSIGSDSDPGEDQFQQKQLKNLIPNFYGVKKNKTKKTKNKKLKQKAKHAEPQQVIPTTPAIKTKKNDKQSHYRIYFSGRKSCMQNKVFINKVALEVKEAGVQASFPEPNILKGVNNMPVTVTTLVQKKSPLCIFGQKVQEEVTVFGGSIGIQADMIKVFTQNRQEQRKSLPRKSFKVTSRISSVLQVKENNFLNRADCHTLQARSQSRR